MKKLLNNCMTIRNFAQKKFVVILGGLLLGACLLVGGAGCSEPQGTDVVECATDADCGNHGVCTQGGCGCAMGFDDCDGDSNNGCEFEGACECKLGETRSCYSGPAATEGIGTCKAGTQSCEVGGWASCSGEVIPIVEACEQNNLDEDCDGVIDNQTDIDGDGYSICDGDCCDSELQGCAENPALINPGAMDFDGNNLDDDCDGVVDNPVPVDCSASESLDDTTALKLANALELCSMVQSDGSGYGLMAAGLSSASGEQTPEQIQSGVLDSFGGIVLPVKNQTMVVLSSGRARGVGDPGYVSNGINYRSMFGGVGEAVPERYLSQNLGELRSFTGCPAGNDKVYDSVRLRLKIRAPSNAQGFEFRFRFFSHEYSDYLCTDSNDFFLVQLDSQHPDIPKDGNIAFDSNGNPISVNNAFFTTCTPLACDSEDNTGDPTPSFMFAPSDEAEQAPSGGVDNDGDGCPDSLSCNTDTNLCENASGACPDGPDDVLAYAESAAVAGATSWLTTTAPIVPGESITLDFYIWDTSNQDVDSLVLIDSFKWLNEPTMVRTKK